MIEEQFILRSLSTSASDNLPDMIRLCPTSIGLAESDIQNHLQQINFYQQLLADGFKREQIQRFYEEQQAARRDQENDIGSASDASPSCSSLDGPHPDCEPSQLSQIAQDSSYDLHVVERGRFATGLYLPPKADETRNLFSAPRNRVVAPGDVCQCTIPPCSCSSKLASPFCSECYFTSFIVTGRERSPGTEHMFR